ncbi:ABC transporter permease subunit [Auraticoccus sp. F435]|uniref:ABC transporter permease subunit n=1 Tax=Auraticoccus cholistanensis TaxID=2656650 RepID=A0A6A9UQ81_9ACTN|nr:carbohydrate ABC transporter permease [Auraticoccus cholistanensis]MVA74708.1 ABC transporter permease subunit [Auraticoccus cholistanensis]
MRPYTWRTMLLEVGLLAAGVVFFIPFFVLFSVAFRNPDAAPGPLDATWPPNFDNLVTAWTSSAMGPALANSAIITVLSVVPMIVLSSAAAYPLARYTQAWSKGLFYFFVLGLLFAGQAATIPLYILIRDLGLMGTIWAVVLIHVGGAMPFGVFLYTTFLRELPRDYEEAAALDGCGGVKAFARVVFPLMRPITGTLLILQALGCWNDFFIPLIYLSSGSNLTAPLAVYSYVGTYTADWPLVFSALLISIAPILLFYLFAQKHIIKGFAAGLKG